ncbi:protein PET100 homolog, mitochondrial-like [Liolophura sinensis]|uniref:protein PET100 homolog, mitochondrial-like n=1 Tax=Liolophura sinensis TaxID=3198878 RepID=UPI0031596F69
MGGWRLEIFKMALYMSFPVGMFYYFNQPEFFENWMMSKRKELFPPEDENARLAIAKTIDRVERRQERLWQKKMQQSES